MPAVSGSELDTLIIFILIWGIKTWREGLRFSLQSVRWAEGVSAMLPSLASLLGRVQGHPNTWFPLICPFSSLLESSQSSSLFMCLVIVQIGRNLRRVQTQEQDKTFLSGKAGGRCRRNPNSTRYVRMNVSFWPGIGYWGQVVWKPSRSLNKCTVTIASMTFISVSGLDGRDCDLHNIWS